MTNDAVIQMVGAGLSEQVIATAIKQASTKDFDLTPPGLIALNKAHVSNALIRAMQGDTASSSSNDGKRFEGEWRSLNSGDLAVISKDGSKYIVREPHAGTEVCELRNGSLNCGLLSVDFLESSGHITWRGIEMQRVR